MGNPTYCKLLWESIYIYLDGNIYSCCHRDPAVLGNIYKERLQNLWNNKIIKEARLQSISGKLSCFKNCNLIPYVERNQKCQNKKVATNLSSLKRLHITFSGKCNLKCPMCNMPTAYGDYSLPAEVIKRNIDFSEIDKIRFQGGEPFCIKECMEMFLYLGERLGKKVNLLTNGTLINRYWAEKIIQHSQYISISINAATKKTHESINRGSNWKKVLSNIELLKKTRERLGSNLKIYGHMTIIRENIEEIPLFIKFFDRLKLDLLGFGYDRRIVPSWLLENPQKKKRLKEEIAEAIINSYVTINDSRLRYLGLA